MLQVAHHLQTGLRRSTSERSRSQQLRSATLSSRLRAAAASHRHLERHHLSTRPNTHTHAHPHRPSDIHPMHPHPADSTYTSVLLARHNARSVLQGHLAVLGGRRSLRSYVRVRELISRRQHGQATSRRRESTTSPTPKEHAASKIRPPFAMPIRPTCTNLLGLSEFSCSNHLSQKTSDGDGRF